MSGRYFEDFEVGDRYRHARGTTIGEVEGQMLTKLMMNTAQAHFNEDFAQKTPFGGRIVFGLITGSIVIGLAMQDTAENAIAEIGLDTMRFTSPVHYGDTLYAFTEVLGKEEREGPAGVLRLKHWGTKEDGTVVFECERTVLVKRRPVEAAV
jgi:acyl dehydratase